MSTTIRFYGGYRSFRENLALILVELQDADLSSTVFCFNQHLLLCIYAICFFFESICEYLSHNHFVKIDNICMHMYS